MDIAQWVFLHNFLSLMPRIFFLFILKLESSKFQIVYEEHAIICVWTCMVIRIGIEYLSTFESPLSAMNFKSININLLCVLFLWNQLYMHSYHRKKAPRCLHTFYGAIITKLNHTKCINPLKVCTTKGCLFSMKRMSLKIFHGNMAYKLIFILSKLIADEGRASSLAFWMWIDFIYLILWMRYIFWMW